MRKVICPYCGAQADYTDSKNIYHGHSYGMIYICRACDAYVGVHSGSDMPKGTLANAELRYWRRLAHAAFDPLWQSGAFYRRRNAAYSWLSEKMALSKEEKDRKCDEVAQKFIEAGADKVFYTIEDLAEYLLG